MRAWSGSGGWRLSPSRGTGGGGTKAVPAVLDSLTKMRCWKVGYEVSKIQDFYTCKLDTRSGDYSTLLCLFGGSNQQAAIPPSLPPPLPPLFPPSLSLPPPSLSPSSPPSFPSSLPLSVSLYPPSFPPVSLSLPPQGDQQWISFHQQVTKDKLVWIIGSPVPFISLYMRPSPSS